MASSHKYNRSEGCSICSTKNSTSQFRPWYDHYSEETYCRVFKLPSLSGRRGFVCNPCVLYIKRAIQSLDSPTREQLANPPNHQKRLDSKLKGDTRPVIKDIFPPDASGNVQTAASKEVGYYTRQMKVQPKYVYTGKPFVKLKSRYQLMPAGPWRDPKEFLEDEDNAENDLMHYRSVTLKKGVKTNAQKAEEKRLKEAEEDARLFGEIEDCSSKRVSQTSGRKASRRRSNAGSKTFSARSKRRHSTKEDDDLSDDDDEEESDEEGKTPSICTDDSDESSSEMKQTADDVDTEAVSEPSCSSKKGKMSMDDETAKCSKMAKYMSSLSSKKEEAKEESDFNIGTLSLKPARPTLSPKRINRRFPRRPIRNKKPPKVSFFDCSYWQKFPMCCADLYVGEGGMVVVAPHVEGMDLKKLKCPILAKQTAKRMAKIRLERKLKMQAVAAAAAAAAAAASSEAVSSAASLKKEIVAPSPLSSGDDELNDSRNFPTTSPLVEASLHVQAFNFFNVQSDKSQSSTSKASSTVSSNS